MILTCIACVEGHVKAISWHGASGGGMHGSVFCILTDGSGTRSSPEKVRGASYYENRVLEY